MPRSRPASNPLSYHKHTGQYYVTREGKRVYLGAEREKAMEKYHRMALGLADLPQPTRSVLLTAKELANRFVAAQQANWRNPEQTLHNYRNWLGRFLKDHPALRVSEFTVEMFAAWKISLRKRGYSCESINNYLGAVRAIYRFAEDTELIERAPRFRRVKNEAYNAVRSKDKPLYTSKDIKALLENADHQLRLMILFGLNCGFGPKDLQNISWDDVKDDRVSLARSKTGIGQTFLLWPETLQALGHLRQHRNELIARMTKRGRHRSDGGSVFITRFWKPWSKDSLLEPMG